MTVGFDNMEVIVDLKMSSLGRVIRIGLRGELEVWKGT